MSALNVIILAAGLGTRMKSSLPKMLHRVLDKPMLVYPIEAALGMGAERVIVVLGHGAEKVSAELTARFGDKVVFAHQPEPRGTADAVRAALPAILGSDAPCLILNGDLPLLRAEDLAAFASLEGSLLRFATFFIESPKGYGRVIRLEGVATRVVEDKDANAEERAIQEVNAGVYLVDATFLRGALSEVKSNNAQHEFYLPELVRMAAEERRVSTVVLSKESMSGVNDRSELAQIESLARRRRNHQVMLAGVTLLDPERTYLSAESLISPDVIIGPNVSIRGKTVIESNTIIGDGTIIKDSKIRAGVEVRAYCVLDQAEVAEHCIIGPFAHLRPGSKLSARVHVGNFVETKNTTMGEGAKANHLTYLGDASIGEKTNVGAGTITCNYDGVNKHKTTIGDGVFVGSDVHFIAPVTIGDGAIIAAGSCISEDVPSEAIAITRVKQENRPEAARRYWAKRRKDK
jgi:bifunctional UDP-N-acetylglucosamine pyrophosphorylase / glucosamine-1-phosphate N-acetyltransferase